MTTKMISFFNFIKNGLLKNNNDENHDDDDDGKDVKKSAASTTYSVPSYRCPLNDVYAVRETKKHRIGQGQFGEVFRGRDKKTGDEVACKKNMILNRKMKEQVMHEIRMMERVNETVDRDKAVQLKAVVLNKTSIYIIMDAMKGGELFYRLKERKSYSEKDASKIFKTIASTVKQMHRNDLLHRDLKPSNVMFRDKTEDSDLVLIDFGLSLDMKQKQKDPYRISPFVGTPGFAAPEVCDRKFTKAGDVYV